MFTRLVFILLFLSHSASAASIVCISGDSIADIQYIIAGVGTNKTATVNIFQGLDSLVIDPLLPIGGAVHSESISTASTSTYVVCTDNDDESIAPSVELAVGSSSFSQMSYATSTMLDIGIDGLALKVESIGDQIVPAFSFPPDTSLSDWGITIADEDDELLSNFLLTTGQLLGLGSYTFTIVKTGETVSPGTSSTGTVMGLTLAPIGQPSLIFSLASPISVTNTCTVTNKAIDVDLGTHSILEFTGVGATSRSTRFDIDVACSGPTTAYITLEDSNTASDSDNGVLGLNTDATASGVGIQVTDSTGAVIPLNTATKAASITTGGNQTIELQARLYQTASSVTEGNIEASAIFTLGYE
ncbi:fimbrial protein [Brenneria goodwinii]|uniref:fimbrial protein n=1 Tax=Brenneria goodwinii TaxID=1109412 RepID=UPI0036E0395D